MAKKKKKENYLDYIPAVSSRNTWDADKDGKVTIHMVHRGVYAWIAQKAFRRPRVSHIHLDEMGSFIFGKIDGQRTVGDIALLVKEQFGQEADPLYERLVHYMKILYNNGFIGYVKQNKKKGDQANGSSGTVGA
jgi:hypothetical protein